MTLTEEPVFLPSIKSREEAKHKWDINDNSLPLVSRRENKENTFIKP